MHMPDHEPIPADASERPCTIRYVGVGGAGSKFISLLAAGGYPLESLVAMAGDEMHLRGNGARKTILLESRLLRGVGTGGDPDLGRTAAEEMSPAIKPVFEGVNVAVIITGLGGGTGSGAAPVIARLAHEAGALVLVFAMLPFDCEGRRKRSQAEAGLEELKAVADGVLCLPNQRLFKIVEGGRTLLDAFRTGTDHLMGGVESVRRLLTRRGLIEIKFSSLCAALRGRHACSSFATVMAAGPDRAQAALDRLLAHPMLEEGRALGGADAVLVSIAGGTDLGMDEVDRLMGQLQEHCLDAEVLFGADIDPSFEGRISVTIIATQRRPAVPAMAEPDVVAAAPVQPAVSAEGQGHGFMAAGPLPLQESRLVPPPPELTQEKRWEVLEKHSRRGGRRGGPKMRQGQLPLQIVSKGRFDKTEPTLHNGEDLDMPTYLRRGVALN